MGFIYEKLIVKTSVVSSIVPYLKIFTHFCETMSWKQTF